MMDMLPPFVERQLQPVLVGDLSLLGKFGKARGYRIVCRGIAEPRGQPGSGLFGRTVHPCDKIAANSGITHHAITEI